MTNNRRILPPDQLRREKIVPHRDIIPMHEAQMPRFGRPEVEWDKKQDTIRIRLDSQEFIFDASRSTCVISLICEALRLRGEK